MSRSFGELLVRFGEPDRGRAWRLTVVLAALLGEVVFRAIDWTWLQLPVRDAVIAASNTLGFAAEPGAGLLYSVDGGSYELTPRCTYADLLCMLTPLALRFDGLGRDLRRVAILWTAVVAVTVVRVAVACALHEQGVAWWLAHDAISAGLRIGALLLALRLWMAFAVTRAAGSPAPVPSRA